MLGAHILSLGDMMITNLHLHGKADAHADIMGVCLRRWPLLQPLGTSLAHMAAAIGPQGCAYWEHYARDLGPTRLAAEGAPRPQCAAAAGTAGDAAAAPASAAPAEPIDMYRVLQRMLHGHAPPKSLAASLAAAGPCILQRTRRVIACYGLLRQCARKCNALAMAAAAAGGGVDWAGSSPHRQQAQVRPLQAQGLGAAQELVQGASQALVLAMARQGWSWLEVDTLPLGVALPLKEALQRCRGSLPQGVGVGRWVQVWVWRVCWCGWEDGCGGAELGGGVGFQGTIA